MTLNGAEKKRITELWLRGLTARRIAKSLGVASVKGAVTAIEKQVAAVKADVAKSKLGPVKNPGGALDAARAKDAAVDQAARLSEKFHGRPARGLREWRGDIAFVSTFATLGRLRWLQVQLERGGAVKVAWPDDHTAPMVESSPDGRQLYLNGGKHAIDFARLGVEVAGKHLVTVGRVERICYHTEKGFHKFEPVDYAHWFGRREKRADLLAPWQLKVARAARIPVLLWDALNQRLLLSGGAYLVRPEGIVF